MGAELLNNSTTPSNMATTNMSKGNHFQSNNQISDKKIPVIPLSGSKRAFLCVEVTMKAKNNQITYTYSVYREGFLKIINSLGYFKKGKGKRYYYIKEENGVIWEVAKTEIRDTFYEYIKGFGDIKNDMLSEALPNFETLPNEAIVELCRRQQTNLFIDAILESLPTNTKTILRDTEKFCCKPFLNGVVKIEATGMTFIPYEEIEEVIWKDSIIQHDFVFVENNECHFSRFVDNVSGVNLRSFVSAIGYLLHAFNDRSKGQSVILNDSVPTDRNQPQGGTGKGIYVTAISLLIYTKKIDGKKLKNANQFIWQQIDESTKLVCLDDLDKSFDFSILHSVLTDGITIEKKNQQEYNIDPADSPKFVLSSNFAIQGEGSTNKRRQFVLEFQPHYSNQIKTGTEEPIKKEHGCIFFSDDWDIQEWQRFYYFMCDCIVNYLQHGLIQPVESNLMQNKLIQSTSDEFAEFVQANIQSGVEYETKTKFLEYRDLYYGSESDLKQRSFTNYLKTYCAIFEKEIKMLTKSNLSYFTINNRIL